jgi:hypothetical protein
MKSDLIALAYAVTVFVSLFINVPVSVKVNALDVVVKQLYPPILFETSRINEVLLIKLALTYMLFTKTSMCLREFVAYALGLEALLLLVVRKASFILHTSTSILFFYLLEKIAHEHRPDYKH